MPNTFKPSQPPKSWNGEDRRTNPIEAPNVWLTEEQIEMIAERAAGVAVKKMTDDAYKAIGKGVVNKTLVVLGVLGLAGYYWLQTKGLVK